MQIFHPGSEELTPTTRLLGMALSLQYRQIKKFLALSLSVSGIFTVMSRINSGSGMKAMTALQRQICPPEIFL